MAAATATRTAEVPDVEVHFTPDEVASMHLLPFRSADDVRQAIHDGHLRAKVVPPARPEKTARRRRPRYLVPKSAIAEYWENLPDAQPKTSGRPTKPAGTKRRVEAPLKGVKRFY